MNEPISGALDRLTTEGGRVALLLRARLKLIRALVQARRLMRASPIPSPA